MNKNIAKSLRATKKHVTVRNYNTESGKSYRSPFTCNCIQFGVQDLNALNYYSSIYQLRYTTFEDDDEPVNKEQAYTARIIALELVALLAEGGQEFS